MVQKQHIPGYTGHVHGVICENLHGESFARTTATSMNGRMQRGNEMPPDKRFCSTQRHSFSTNNFRRFVEQPKSVPRKDYTDYAKTINDENPVDKKGIFAQTNAMSMKNMRLPTEQET